MSLTGMFLSGWAVMAVVMTALWLRQRRTENAGTVDVAWAFGTGAMAVVYALGTEGGEPFRQGLVAVLGGLWGARLGHHLLRRLGGEADEDGRYRHLRGRAGDRAQPVMLAVFQVQAFWVPLFALPMWVAATAPGPAPTWHDWLGLGLWLVALGGESLADAQLRRFRADPRARGEVCDRGLWRYSRHPNYFFEWLHWFAYAAIAFGSPHWWVTLAAIAVMYVFLTRLTGIPWAEDQSLRSRGDAYRRYQRRTSSFFPLPPRAAGGPGG